MDSDLEEEVSVCAMDIVPKALPLEAKGSRELTEAEKEERLARIQYGEEVTPIEKERFSNLFRKYIHVFAFDYTDLREVTLEQHQIPLKPVVLPRREKQRRINPHLSQMVKEEIDKLLKAWFIFLVENSEWVSPIVVTKKKSGKLRICIDYQKLNAGTRRDYYPIPFMDDIMDEVVGHEWYSFGDGYSGYNQIHIAKEDQLKITFTTPWGTFAYRVMPFGLFNAPATF